MLTFRMLHRSRLTMLSAFVFASARRVCRKYRIGWLLTLTKDGNRETAIHVRPNEVREPSMGWIEGKTHHGGPTNTS
jgi:hypothetical protein